MDKFKVGQYVVFMDDPYLIHKVVRVVNDNQVELEYPNCGCVSHRIVGVALIRQVLNIDYIHTLPSEQMAKVMSFKVKDYCNAMCPWEFPHDDCVRCIKSWLNKSYDGWEVSL